MVTLILWNAGSSFELEFTDRQTARIALAEKLYWHAGGWQRIELRQFLSTETLYANE